MGIWGFGIVLLSDRAGLQRGHRGSRPTGDGGELAFTFSLGGHSHGNSNSNGGVGDLQFSSILMGFMFLNSLSNSHHLVAPRPYSYPHSMKTAESGGGSEA